MLLTLAAALALPPAAEAAGPAASRLVVILYPQNNDGSPGHVLADQAIRATFAASPAERIEVYAEYLDAAQPHDADDRHFQTEYLRRKYAGRKVDLVIVGLSPALDFALAHRAELFPGVPIVFCAVDRREVAARKLPPDVVGVPITMDLTGTLDLALRLQPQTRRVCVVAGRAAMDTAWVAEARREFRPYEGRLEFEYLIGLPLGDLMTRLARLPERTIVYYLHVFQDGTGAARVPAHVLEQLAQAANAPIYGHVDSYIGRGVVGGRVFSFEDAGATAARVGLRLLAGEPPERVGVREASASAAVFDWRQLRRWGIGEDRLPPDSVVRHKASSFWDVYKWPIVGVLSLCVVETLLISALLVQRSNRRRADRRFRQVIEAAPAGMVMVGRDGTIVLANAQTEALFGYGKDELLGQPVEMLLPERFRGRHPGHRADYCAAPAVRAMGAGQELFGRRKDGTDVPVEIGLSPVQTDGGLFVLTSVIDVTERRRAEAALRHSRGELRDLTGRLLVAQETERRRIARELHDDLNQTLALLVVELDLLGRTPAASAADLGRQVRGMSDRVKDLSAAVHDLSHQLHPSKLGQLGLVAAVRSLCRELSQGHGLPIDFSHRGVPAAIPEDTALCLYRIAQEALRNAVKHSGARRAGVTLSGGGDALLLSVNDDGTGFDPAAADGRGGLGLVSMRERLRLVGGTIGIDSRSPGGTRIDVRVPLGTNGRADGVFRGQPGGCGDEAVGVPAAGGLR